MKACLVFKLPKEQTEFDHAVRAEDAFATLVEVRNLLLECDGTSVGPSLSMSVSGCLRLINSFLLSGNA